MKKIFLPDFIFNSYSDLTPQFLLGRNIDTLVLDIDNTLVPYEVDKPTKELYEWFSSLEENGIRVAFVSNNDKKRVELFNEELLYTAFYKSKKPLLGTVKKVMNILGAVPQKTLLMGDQIFTDILAGNRMGFYTALLPPIKDKTDLFTKFKRAMEKPIIRKYHKRLEKNNER